MPKDPGSAGVAGGGLQNGLYAAAAPARWLARAFGTSRQISTGPSSGLRGRRGERSRGDRHHRNPGRGVLRGRDHSSFRALVPSACGAREWGGSRSSSRGPWWPDSCSAPPSICVIEPLPELTDQDHSSIRWGTVVLVRVAGRFQPRDRSCRHGKRRQIYLRGEVIAPTVPRDLVLVGERRARVESLF